MDLCGNEAKNKEDDNKVWKLLRNYDIISKYFEITELKG